MQNRLVTVAILFVGIAVGIIGWNIMTLAAPSPVYGDATSGSAGGLIAVTGLCTNNASGLWVLDARDTDKTPSLCLYLPMDSGRGFKLAAARRIKYDFQLPTYNDKSDSALSPAKMARTLKDLEEKAERDKK